MPSDLHGPTVPPLTYAPMALWVSPVSNLAGVARHIIDAARSGLPGWRLIVTAPEGPLLDELRALGCPVIPLDVDQPVRHAVADLRHTIRTLRPGVVHSHLAKADFLAAMASVGLGTTLISTEHHLQDDRLALHASLLKARTREAAHHARIRRFDHLIAVSDSTKATMLRRWRPSAPITVIKNGIDRPTTREREPGLRILSLTRLAPEKNVAQTIRAFAHVVQQHPQATLTVAGEGPEAAALKQLAHDLGISAAVEFPGFIDAHRALDEHDVLVQPSKADNLSYTLLDAVAAGLGVVASKVGGNPEILPERSMVSADDDAALAAAIVQQGLELATRPSVPDTIPTVGEMTTAITQVYPAIKSQRGSVAVGAQR